MKLRRISLLLFLCSLLYAGEHDNVVKFLRDMMEHSKFENYDFLNAHCSGDLLKKLEADYDYECEDGPCYAVWKFREGASDVLKWKVMEVEPIDDGWYLYTFQENDVVSSRRVHVRVENDSVILLDLKP